jgi:Ni/Co efflux regulator RcnB
MKRLFLPFIAAAFVLSTPVATIAAPHQSNHERSDARKSARQTQKAKSATRKATRARERAHIATVHARKTTKRANRATARSQRAAVHARQISNRARRDLQRYRGAVRAQHRYHWNTWHRPSGWAYRRWSVGGYMPRNWYARDYWITNYLAFSLLAPPPDYEWIRQGPDAVLVDINTGAVLRVEYDVFY